MQLRSLAYRFVEWKNGAEVWKFQGSKYSAAAIWNEIRPRRDRREWHQLVWTPLSIPKHVVVSWMAILDRLPTLDHMTSWGMEVNSTCRLCQNAMESRDYLFFSCSYSKDVWRSILQLYGLNRRIMSWY